MRDQRVRLDRAQVKSDQRSRQIENLKYDEGPARINPLLEPGLPGPLKFRDRWL